MNRGCFTQAVPLNQTSKKELAPKSGSRQKVHPPLPLAAKGNTPSKALWPDQRPYIPVLLVEPLDFDLEKANTEARQQQSQSAERGATSWASGSQTSAYEKIDLRPISLPLPGHSTFGPFPFSRIKKINLNEEPIVLLKLRPRWQRVLTRYIGTPLRNTINWLMTPLRMVGGFCLRIIAIARQKAEEYLTIAILNLFPARPEISAKDSAQKLIITIGEESIQLDKTEHEKKFRPHVHRDFRVIKAQTDKFSVLFYISESDFQAAPEEEIRTSAEIFVGAYQRAIGRLANLGFKVPSGATFEMIFGETNSGLPHHSKGRVYPHIIKFASQLSVRFQEILEHEIGHNLSHLILNGVLNSSEFIALEEGIAQYAAGAENTPVLRNLPGTYHQIQVTPAQAAQIAGLTQLDIEKSMGGHLSSSPVIPSVYRGLTTHLFGLEFILAFKIAFPEEPLVDFLRQIGTFQREAYSDHGTEFIREELRRMMAGELGIEENIAAFERFLHERLIGSQRVFSTEGGVPLT